MLTWSHRRRFISQRGAYHPIVLAKWGLPPPPHQIRHYTETMHNHVSDVSARCGMVTLVCGIRYGVGHMTQNNGSYPKDKQHDIVLRRNQIAKGQLTYPTL